MPVRSIGSLEGMRALATEIASGFINKKRLLILLNGEMGAGKTQFTRFLVEALGGGETASPSFAIHHSYALNVHSLEHFDLFRLQSEDELESTGFWDLFRIASGVIVIEWAERLSELNLRDQLPLTWPTVELSIALGDGDQQRLVTITERNR